MRRLPSVSVLLLETNGEDVVAGSWRLFSVNATYYKKEIPVARCWIALLVLGVGTLPLGGCGKVGKVQTPEPPKALSHAVLAEFGQENTLMDGGLNRRVFNQVLSERGDKIALDEDGSVSIQPGSYRISGLSLITMQDVLTPISANEVYPGYCVVYDCRYDGREALSSAVAVGTMGVALYSSPSIFDTVVTFSEPTEICLGHQAGQVIKENVYLTYIDGDPEGPSDARIFAQMSIFELGD